MNGCGVRSSAPRVNFQLARFLDRLPGVDYLAAVERCERPGRAAPRLSWSPVMLIAEITMFIGGLAALVTGQLTFRRGADASGVRARIAGGLLMLPVPVALIIGFSAGSRVRTQEQLDS